MASSTGSQSTSGRVEGAMRLMDRIRGTSRKTVELEKLNSELHTIYDKVRSLENKAMDADRLELSMEALRRNLENTQQQVNDTARELRIETRYKDNIQKQLEEAEKKLHSERDGSKDLRLQVMEELQRNATLEKKVEALEKFRQRCVDMERGQDELQKQAHEQAMIAQHARKCLRDEREKWKEQNNQADMHKKLEEDLMVTQSENATLRKMLAAKQTLLLHHIQIIKNAKKHIRSLQKGSSGEEYHRILQILDSPAPDNISPTQPVSNGYAFNDSKTYHKGGHTSHNSSSNTSLLHTILSTEEGSQASFASSSDRLLYSSSRSNHHLSASSFADFRRHGLDSPSPKDNRLWATPVNGETRLQRSNSAREAGFETRLSRFRRNWDENNKAKTEEKEELPDNYEELLRQCVSVGDRVIVDATPAKAASAGPQGRQVRGKKLVYAPGKVMYIGHLENARDPSIVYIGLNMDEQVGNSDGIFKGQRYFTSQPRHGKFLPIKKLVSVLDSKSGKFKKVDSLIESTQKKDHNTRKTQIKMTRDDLQDTLYI